MEKSLNKNKHLIIILLSILIFSPALFNYFSGDDWFHLRISNIGNLNPFLFFSFIPNQFSAAFYRPISTQLFFYIFYQLFKLDTFFYYLFGLILFGTVLKLVYEVTLNLADSKKLAFLSLIIYSFSATNFSRIYFLSAYQELFMMCFLLLSLLAFLRNKTLISLIFFILALGSKETAVVFPIILIGLKITLKDFSVKRLLPFLSFTLVYLFLRIYLFGLASGDSYIWNFSLPKALNTFGWYTIWVLGAPEFLVDYIGSGVKIIPRFFSQFPIWSKIILLTIFLTVTSFIVLLVRIRKLDKLVIFGSVVYLAGLAPVIFLPQHKFTLELTLSLWGFSLVLAWILEKNKKTISAIFIAIFLITNLCSYIISYQTSYILSRGRISKVVINILNTSYPEKVNKPFLIANSIDLSQTSKEWGDSKQIAQAVSNGDLFKVYYKNLDIDVYYQDLEKIPLNKDFITISTSSIYNQLKK